MLLRRLSALLTLFALFLTPAVLAQEEEVQEVQEVQEEQAPPHDASAEGQDEERAEDEEKDKEEDEEDKDPINAALLSPFKLRGIGPALTSGRIGDFAVDPDNRAHYYAAACSGGVWETWNAGTTWKPIFDGQASYSIGCIEMDPNDSNVLWVGSGENNSQRSVSFGDGVYKSVDAGRSWKNVGLKESEHIGMIAIDPRDSNVVYIAAQGPLWRDGGDRGLYKTIDGGESWEKVLEISDKTGVNEVLIDPRDPDVLYASSYQRRRRVWTLINGGPESGVWKSTDAGANWKKINRGLPGGDKGRIGMAMSPVDPDVLYAIVEASGSSGGVYRTKNGGTTWERRSSYMTSSPQYYNELVCHPTDVDTFFALDTLLQRSTDGGATFKSMPRRRRHVDDHALWIDPNDTNYFLVGCDGGVYESLDAGQNWRYMPNLPLTQFYRVEVDNSLPFYFVYGGTQDNNTQGGPSRTLSSSGIMNEDWFITVGGDGFEPQIDPLNPNIVYSQSQHGGLVRFDRQSGERIGIQPQEEPGDEALKWNWNSPIRISPHDPRRLYFGAQILYRSDDRGNSWRKVSGDLTRQLDRNQLEVMGQIQKLDAVSKHRSTSNWGSLVALSESRLVEGLIYVGTDDGLIQVTEDGGENWRKIEAQTIADGLPELIYVSWVDASKHDADTVFAAFDDHKSGNFAPLVYRSRDRGLTWESIVGDLPDRQIVYSLAEDPIDPDLLFVGTEFGLYVTLDGGGKWMRIKSGMPTIAIRDLDLQEREGDLVLASFGRGFFVLDDYAAMREFDREKFETNDALLFPIRPALAYTQSGRSHGSLGASHYSASNPPFGATFTYWMKDKGPLTKKEERKKREGERKKNKEPYVHPTYEELKAEENEISPKVELVVRNDEGAVIRRLAASRSKGMHRTTWDLRWNAWAGSRGGPRAVPGTYTVELVRKTVEGTTSLAGPETFEVKSLGLASLPATDHAVMLAYQEEVSRLQNALAAAMRVATRQQERLDYARDSLANLRDDDGIDAFRADLEKVQERYREAMRMIRGGDPARSQLGELTPPSLQSRVFRAVGGLWSSSNAPTQTARDQLKFASEAFGPALAELRGLEKDIESLEDRLMKMGAPYVPGRLPSWP